MRQQVITPPLWREASRTVAVKSSCNTSQFCILNHTVPVFVKDASCIDSYVRFSPVLLLGFWQNSPSSDRRRQGLVKKITEEREDTAYEPEEVESEAETQKKGRKKKEEPDPFLTMGTDIEDYL